MENNCIQVHELLEDDLYSKELLRDILERDKGIQQRTKTLHENYVVRPLNSGDFDKGYLELLRHLTSVGDVTKETFIKRFQSMKSCKNTYYITVVEDCSNGQIIASTSLVLEQKFIHNAGLKSKLEDVVVHENYRGQSLSKLLVDIALSLANYLKCYKITLECKDELISFYLSLGFTKEQGNSTYMYKRYIID